MPKPKIEKSCMYCNKNNLYSKIRAKKQKFFFCNMDCLGKFKSNKVKTSCCICNKELYRTEKWSKTGKMYCSRKCFSKVCSKNFGILSEKTGSVIKCKTCKNSYYRIKSSNRKFCSNECYGIFLKGKTPNNFILTEQQKKDISVLKSEKMKGRKQNKEWIDKRTLSRIKNGNTKPSKATRLKNSNTQKRLWDTGVFSREKRSKEKKLFFKLHPEKHPNLIVSRKPSKGQQELYNVFKTYFSDAILEHKINTKQGLRFADIASPSNKIIFEFDGKYWHRNSQKKDIKRRKELNEEGWMVFNFDEDSLHLAKNTIEVLLI